ncbi:hypothetical protein CFE70_002893 [Pyrenophora teres f. teres 0-1]|uniref:Uncharacterized protein n=2 Tax=Pyrenophora teres f. teres TaxID=97479 RepID=E3RYU2_PYRTT|nr:hypothetical protein PTT_14747 [Pyrenophora teres f. teres 0-1]KAE8823770.1 hypothetical protein PTNB85_09895 [Pyrenophora teres f. teres]KAE8846595.1 hypothetical protein HRS9139_01162 [Pyrenophora teres f. teres]KAE8852540.1 hypothetical protein PTNB29_10441 [Pyrenophora teres f. teres]KAE8853093.1 hypothetical protein HRS9122_00085 [Pyrenophora teres f. teres]
MSEQVLFNPEPFNPSVVVKPPTTGFQRPTDRLTVPPVNPDTIWYLAVIKPHMDTHEIIGPVTAFKYLLPKIQDVVSNSPRAIDKLEELMEIEDMWGEREKNLEFERSGFERFIVEGQRGVYTVLKIMREINKKVFEILPAPVYTVISLGPLEQGKKSGKGQYTKPKGFAETTTLHGSWSDRESAVKMARVVMEDLLSEEPYTKSTEVWEKGNGNKGGGMLMAMNGTYMWEVKVIYEDQAIKRAMEEAGRDGKGKVWE